MMFNQLLQSKFQWPLTMVMIIQYAISLGQNVGIGTTSPSGRLHVIAPSGFTFPLLRVEIEGMASPIFVIGSDGKVGVGVANPSEALDILGNVKFSGALMPGGNTGTLGQVLISQGAGNPPQWVTPNFGDNWGSQVAVTQGPIVGDGTPANPITFSNGTMAGQVWKWDGSQWILASDSVGDNWGNQVAQTQGPLIGDGTGANPIGLQSGTNAGEVLIWNGSQWTIKPSPFDSVCNSAIANYVMKWTGSELCNSIIYDDGVGVGIGTSSPHPDAILELNSNNKGFLPPRVALVAANLPNPLSSPAPGMLVYNTNTSGTGQNAVTPGYYYWDGARWQRLQNNAYAGAIFGTQGTTNQILDARSGSEAECTGATITLPPGKWIVYMTEIIRVVTDSTFPATSPCYVWVRSTLGDGACAQHQKVAGTLPYSTDIIGSGLVSGSIYSGGIFDQVQGNIIINNTSGTLKTYSIWANIQIGPGCSLGSDGITTNDGIWNFFGPWWGETVFMALPAQ